jgi:hypothetical protein
MPIDRSGGPTVDPTENVKALNAASDERQSDLAAAFQDYVALLDRRQDDLRKADIEHLEKVANLRASYEKELREKETQRIDAINLNNSAAVQAAAEVQRAQASLLANQVATTGETLRAQVASVASAQEQRLTTILEPITKAIESLRQTQYEQQGKNTAATDPVLQAIRDLQLSQGAQAGAHTATTENRQQSNWSIGALISLVGVLISLAALVVVLVKVG